MQPDSGKVARHDKGCITAPNQQSTMFKSVLALESFYDFALYGTPPDGESTDTLKPVRTLKVVLAAGSEYFRALFTNNNFDDSQKNEHTSDKFSHECITAVVELLHTGNVDGKSSDFAMELREAVQFYLMNDLVSACEVFLVNNLEADNCVDFWKVACQESSSSTLTAGTEKYIAKNLSRIMTGSSLLTLKADDFCKLLLIKAVVSSTSTDICLQAAMAWLEYDPNNRQTSSDDVLNSISLSPGLISRKVLISACQSEALSQAAKEKLLGLCVNQLDIGDTYEFISVPNYVEPSCLNSSSEIENLYFVGGYNKEQRRQFLQYNVNRKEWIEMDPLPCDRPYCVAGVFDGDKLWVGGGQKHGEATTDVDEFTLSRSSWNISNKVATLPRSLNTWQACGSQQSVYLSNHLDEFITYSPQTKEIVTKKAMPFKRSWHSTSYSATLNAVFIADGWSTIGTVTTHYPRIDKYDIVSNAWQSVGFAKIKCSQRASALCGDELYLIGGHDGAGGLKKAEVCNVRTGKTRSLPDLSHIRNFSRAALLYNNVICVFGSVINNTNSPVTKSVDAYDVREGKWTVVKLLK